MVGIFLAYFLEGEYAIQLLLLLFSVCAIFTGPVNQPELHLSREEYLENSRRLRAMTILLACIAVTMVLMQINIASYCVTGLLIAAISVVAGKFIQNRRYSQCSQKEKYCRLFFLADFFAPARAKSELRFTFPERRFSLFVLYEQREAPLFLFEADRSSKSFFLARQLAYWRRGEPLRKNEKTVTCWEKAEVFFPHFAIYSIRSKKTEEVKARAGRLAQAEDS